MANSSVLKSYIYGHPLINQANNKEAYNNADKENSNFDTDRMILFRGLVPMSMSTHSILLL